MLSPNCAKTRIHACNKKGEMHILTVFYLQPKPADFVTSGAFKLKRIRAPAQRVVFERETRIITK